MVSTSASFGRTQFNLIRSRYNIPFADGDKAQRNHLSGIMKLMCRSVKKEGREQTFGEHSQPRDRHKPLLSHHCGLDQKQVPCLRKSISRFVMADRLPVQGLQKRHREGKQDPLNVGTEAARYGISRMH